MKMNERGGLNVLLIPLILSVVFFFGALGFGIWAFMSRADYKNNSDQKAAAAVQVAVQKANTDKDNEFLQREKEPLRDYQGPDTLGNIQFKYPKTWSGYYKSSDKELSLVMHPKLVNGTDKGNYALRVEVVSNSYDKTVKALETNIKSGKLTSDPFRLDKVPSVVGIKVSGELSNSKKGSMVVLPLRDKTVRISTESEEFTGDFEGIILKNFSFSP